MSDLARDAQALGPQLVAWRRALHEWPELGFEEERTAALVAGSLRDLGIETRTGVARTGVVGLLRAGASRGPAVLLRADMDALPVQEVAGREYGSKVPGRMHACGHDGHVAMLLGAARLLAARRHLLARDVVLCFQPAEEGGGGARAMIDAGLLDWVPVGEAFALHLWAPFRVGSVHVRSGPIMAAQDEFTAHIVGRGGHGALPHLALDPVVAAAHGVVALQAIVARSVDPVETAVVTVGSIHAGSAPNVIPETAVLHGTLRSFTEPVRELLRRRVVESLEHAAGATGCAARVEMRPGYPAVINDARAVDRVRRAARRVVGDGRVVEAAPLAAAEDFAYVLEKVAGAFVLVGAGNPERGISAPHHAPAFDLDEAALPLGAELLARLALPDDAPDAPH